MHSIQLSLRDLVIGLALASVIGGIAWRLRMLSFSGWIAAGVIGGLTFGFGGFPAAMLLISFFASSSLLSKVFAFRKQSVAANFAKGGRRDWAQVAANGGAAVLALMAAASGWLPIPLAWIAFNSSLATVTADTWATEVGVLSNTKPILITTGKSVPHGTSGGVSILGSGVALLGASMIGLFAWLLGVTSLSSLPLIALAGLLGSSIDSGMGATVQATFFCPKCQKETERHPLHYCGTETRLSRGLRWLDNDWVNFISSFVSAILAAIIFRFFM
jgi:uncharacterized protein (TIGR00297 family)